MLAALTLFIAALPAPAKTLLVPIQPILRSTSDEQARRLTDLLSRELRLVDPGLRVAVPMTAGSTRATGELERLETRAEVTEADRKIDEAVELRQAALDLLSRTLAPGDFQRLRNAHHELARMLLLAGRDAEADQVMARVAGFGEFELPAERYSRYHRLRAATEPDGFGSLRIRGRASGQQAAVDDRALAAPPLVIDGLSQGWHFVEVGPRSFVIEVRSGEVSTLELPEDDEVASIAEAIRNNQWSELARRAASTLGARFGADQVVCGGLSKRKGSLELTLVLIRGDRVTLGEISFDADLLTAESEIPHALETLRRPTVELTGGALAPWLPARPLLVTLALSKPTKQAPETPRDRRGPFKDDGTLAPKDELSPESDRIEETGSFVRK